MLLQLLQSRIVRQTFYDFPFLRKIFIPPASGREGGSPANVPWSINHPLLVTMVPAAAAATAAGVVRRYLINPFRRQQLLLCLIKLVFLVDFRLLTQTMAVALLIFIISTIVTIRIIAMHSTLRKTEENGKTFSSPFQKLISWTMNKQGHGVGEVFEFPSLCASQGYTFNC